MKTLARYRKAFAALLGIAALVVGRHYGLNSEVYLDIVGAGTILGVYGIPNDPQA